MKSETTRSTSSIAIISALWATAEVFIQGNRSVDKEQLEVAQGQDTLSAGVAPWSDNKIPVKCAIASSLKRCANPIRPCCKKKVDRPE